MSDHVVTARDGIELAVRDHGGEGPDVLFVHGAMRTLEDWGPVLRHLSRIRAVAMDLRYHGRSGAPESATRRDFVEDIGSVVETLGLSEPFVIGHSFGGVLALDHAADAACAGVMNIDGFDFRQRDLFDGVDPAAADEFIRDFRYTMPPDSGDDAWLEEQRAMQDQMGATSKVPDEVTAAAFERSFVKTGDRWHRRPSNRFFDIVYGDDGVGDPLATLRRIETPAVYVVCRPPGEAGLFAAARAGLERHVGNIARERPNVRLETIDATHFVIVEQPAEVAALITSLVTG